MRLAFKRLGLTALSCGNVTMEEDMKETQDLFDVAEAGLQTDICDAIVQTKKRCPKCGERRFTPDCACGEGPSRWVR